MAERDAVQNLASLVRTQQKLWTAGGSKVATSELLAGVFLLTEKRKVLKLGAGKCRTLLSLLMVSIELHLLSAFLRESRVLWLLKHLQEGRFLVES